MQNDVNVHSTCGGITGSFTSRYLASWRPASDAANSILAYGFDHAVDNTAQAHGAYADQSAERLDVFDDQGGVRSLAAEPKSDWRAPMSS